MKTIKLTESQIRMIIESSSIDGIGFDKDNNIPDYADHGEVSVSTNISKEDGDEELSKPIKTDDVMNDMSPQSNFANANNGTRITY